jgi:SAM-dependent MidA family methyltransferase
MSSPGSPQPWRQAWDEALYGPRGFYRREQPSDHFRTSAHASPLFAEAVLALVRERGLRSVTDVGAGAGELLSWLHRLAPDLELSGVEVRPRPPGLAPAVGWLRTLPDVMTGLVLANELLDDVPCTVVELDPDGVVRLVEVASDTGEERLAAAADQQAVDWCERWWPLAAPGHRAELGLEREDFWADVCARTSEGLCIAIDYGHLRDARPPGGTLASYRDGRLVPVRLDGSCDVTAHVAVDALAERVSGELVQQRDVLDRLGVSGRRPPLELASTDPAGYVHALSRASEAAELQASPGLGEFWWLLTSRP